MSLTASDFTFVTGMVRQRSSIDLQPGKEYLVESRLAPVARSVGEPDVSALVARLRRGDERLSDAVVDALTRLAQKAEYAGDRTALDVQAAAVFALAA